MTKKEAVEILRHADTDSEVDADDYLKAFDMAVSALEHEADIDHYMTKTRNPALDVKPSKLPTAYSPRHTIRDLWKSKRGSSAKEKDK